MRPNYLPAVIIALLLLIPAMGMFYYFSHSLGGGDDTVKKVVSAFVLEPPPPTWRDDQVHAPKVQLAIQQRGAALREALEALGIPYPPTMAYVRVFKDEKVLELWAGPDRNGTLALVRTFPLCTERQELFLGRKGGRSTPKPDADRAFLPPIPEGFYSIERYFTNDLTYFLALKLDYPNAVDRALTPRRRTFPEVFVRGGCAPDASAHVGTEGIMDVYLVTMEAHAAGQAHVPVHVFPTRMTPEATEDLKRGASSRRRALYDQLQRGFARFEASHLPFTVEAGEDGRYRVDATPVPSRAP